MRSVTIPQVDDLIEARAVLTAAIFGATGLILEGRPAEEEKRIAFGLTIAFRTFMEKMEPILGAQDGGAA